MGVPAWSTTARPFDKSKIKVDIGLSLRVCLGNLTSPTALCLVSTFFKNRVHLSECTLTQRTLVTASFSSAVFKIKGYITSHQHLLDAPSLHSVSMLCGVSF